MDEPQESLPCTDALDPQSAAAQPPQVPCLCDASRLARKVFLMLYQEAQSGAPLNTRDGLGFLYGFTRNFIEMAGRWSTCPQCEPKPDALALAFSLDIANGKPTVGLRYSQDDAGLYDQSKWDAQRVRGGR